MTVIYLTLSSCTKTVKEGTRGHSLKLFLECAHINDRKESFSLRVKNCGMIY